MNQINLKRKIIRDTNSILKEINKKLHQLKIKISKKYNT